MTPGSTRQLHDPCGKIEAKGSCQGKRPAQPAEFIDAPSGSCFVLILNASGIEGLDLGEATHLIKTEGTLEYSPYSILGHWNILVLLKN